MFLPSVAVVGAKPRAASLSALYTVNSQLFVLCTFFRKDRSRQRHECVSKRQDNLSKVEVLGGSIDEASAGSAKGKLNKEPLKYIGTGEYEPVGVAH